VYNNNDKGERTREDFAICHNNNERTNRNILGQCWGKQRGGERDDFLSPYLHLCILNGQFESLGAERMKEKRYILY